MPFCKNDPKKSYKGTEPSPKGLGYCAHCEKIGKIKKGLDGNKWIISTTSQGVKRWIKYNNKKNTKKSTQKSTQKSTEKSKKYYIYGNSYEGDFRIKPYCVEMNSNKVNIYKIDNNGTTYNNLIGHFTTKNIFIGNKTKKNDTYTILLFINKNNYVMINESGIKKMTTNNDKILKYYSLNDIDYPQYSIAVGEKYIYFFGYPEGYLPLNELPKIKNKNSLKETFYEAIKLQPFLISIKSHKLEDNKITLEEFRDIQKKTLDEISLDKIKELARIFGVTTSGNKKELADRIEKLRNVIIYKKE